MMGEDHSLECGMDCSHSHGLGLHMEHSMLQGVVPNAVVWIIIISMASPFMRRAECLGRIIGDGPIWIAFLAMAWMFMWSSDCRSIITVAIGNPVQPLWPTITWSNPISRNHPQVLIQMAHIPPIYGVPIHNLMQHNFGPNHCHVWIVHHLQLRARKSDYRMISKVLLLEMVTPTIFNWPFLPWNRYHYLTLWLQFCKVFPLDALQVVEVHGVLGSSCHQGSTMQSGSSIAL